MENIINSKQYWDNRFKTNWEKFLGNQQTTFFCKMFLEYIPKWLKNEINENKYSFCDFGCAEGDCVSLIKNKFPNIAAEGVDFSEVAINKAKKRFKNLKFFVGDENSLNKKYDIIYSSNTLEHFKNVDKVFKKLLSHSKKHLIVQVPFEEKELIDEHLHRFEYRKIKYKENFFCLSYQQVIDASKYDNSMWPGKQIILIYSNLKNVNWSKIYPLSSHKQIEKLYKKDKSYINKLNKKYSTLLDEKESKISEYSILLDEKESKISEYLTELKKIHNSKMWKLLFMYKSILNFPKRSFKTIIPIDLRKKTKSIVEKFFSSEKNVKLCIPDEIKEEWENWNYKNRKEQSLDIINFSIISWDFRFQRPQQISKELAKKDNRVFYIKNEFIPFKYNKKIDFAPFKIDKKENNIYEITLSATKNLFIYNEKPSKNDLEIIIASIKNLINEAQIINPVSKIDHPFWAFLFDKLSMPVIYDCMDNHSGFSENAKHLLDLETNLFNNADLTIVTSKYLEKSVIKKGINNIELVQNAGDFKHFSKVFIKSLKKPKDISEINKPIIGYYGAIAEWFDTYILENIAKGNPDKAIVLIGDVTNKKVFTLSKKYKNIYLLGEKPYPILPNYLKYFDVCIIPFILNDLIKATHPVKIFEYFAAGKPVVSTKLPEIIDMEEVYFASKSNFNEQINKAFKDKNIISKQKIAKNNTWQKRANTILKRFTKLIFPKISIVLLSYNNPKLLKQSVDSILFRSFYPNFELIIVDNNSNIETLTVLKQYKNNKKVKLILNKKNYGFAKGNNIGLKKATGDFIIIINDDVLVTPGWISRLLYHVKKDNVGLVGPVTNSIGNEAKIELNYKYDNLVNLETKARLYTSSHWGKLLSLNNLAAFCWIMPKSVYQKFGGFDERYGVGLFEDDDYCLNLKKHNHKILCAEDVFIHHFGGMSFKKMKNEKYKKIFEENKFKFEKKWNTTWKKHKYR